MTQYKIVTLGEICRSGGGSIQTGPFGSQLHASDYTKSGVPSIMPQDLKENIIDVTNIARVAEADAARLSKYRVHVNDLVFARRGDVTKRSLVQPESEGWLCGTGCLKVDLGRPPAADPRYLSYAVASPDAREWLVQHSVGAIMPSINTTILAQLPLALPARTEQVRIGKVLGLLDKKIVANGLIVKNTSALASAVFTSTAAGSANFPLTDLATFVNGKAFTKEASGSGRVVVRIAELNSGVGSSTVYSDRDVADQHVARPGDLLFSWSGSLTVRRWFYPEAIINQHIFKVIPKNGYALWLVNQILVQRLAAFRAIASDKATTMGHIQRHHLEEPVMVPSKDDAARVHSLMESLWLRALAAEKENLALVALRDALLPELMSGRMRVRDAEEQVEEVL